jgi:hypothetical protein
MTANSVHQSVGERGIGIQNIGDGNTVTVYAGRAELSLLRDTQETPRNLDSVCQFAG